ncbi:MAG: hypothetical protein ACLUNQ_04995 [Oscillospiraceae bacterium]
MNGQRCPCGRTRVLGAVCLCLGAEAPDEAEAVDEPIPDSVLASGGGRKRRSCVSGQSAFIAARQGDPVGQHICNEYVDYLCAAAS